MSSFTQRRILQRGSLTEQINLCWFDSSTLNQILMIYREIKDKGRTEREQGKKKSTTAPAPKPKICPNKDLNNESSLQK